MPAEFKRLKELFLTAVEKDDPQQREAYLHEACAGDELLRRQVEALLGQHEQAGSFLESPAQPLAATVDSRRPEAAAGGEPPPNKSQEAVGACIGPYKLLQKLGEGGMGTVWVAEQSAPVKRRVALKLIKPGMDSVQVIRRFEQERQALALMDHTNIAKVFDAGTTTEGRPYFVMELVKGVPITKYCDELHLPLRERLELFVPVCQAIQHAHQKGIIHRDLKPSNVLVAMQDGKPVAKVIDFGVAKAMHPPLTDQSLYTEIGQVVGTLEYMSPEQAELSALDIDTRADVYGLGALLYELLTGTTPLDRKRLRETAFPEMLRLIREEEPPRPSMRVSTLGEVATKVATSRKTDLRQLSQLLRNDLDWIVMKSLEKDRNRRYETANSFALDVQRYLADEPVFARPPSTAYRLRKFARRNRAAVLTVAAVAAALLLGTIIATWQAIRATQAQKDAKYQASVAEAVNAFLLDDILANADPANEPNRDLRLRTVLDRASKNIHGRFDQQPLVEAAIRHTLGVTYRSLGLYDEGQPHLVRAIDLYRHELGSEHPLTLRSMHALANLLRESGQTAEAEKLYRQTLALRRRVLGNEHPDTLLTLTQLATSVLRVQNRFAEAEPLTREALETSRRVHGEEHPITVELLYGLSILLHHSGQWAEAESLGRQALALRRQQNGNKNTDTLDAICNLAAILESRGKVDEAEPLCREGLEMSRRVYGDQHRSTVTFKATLGSILLARNNYVAAEPLLVEVLASHEKRQSDNWITFHARCMLGRALLGQKNFAEAEPLLVQGCTGLLQREALIEMHWKPRLTVALQRLVQLYDAWGKPDKAAYWQKKLDFYHETIKEVVKPQDK